MYVYIFTFAQTYIYTHICIYIHIHIYLYKYIFPAQNGEFLRNVVTQLRHLRRRRHGCPTLREPEDTECAP